MRSEREGSLVHLYFRRADEGTADLCIVNVVPSDRHDGLCRVAREERFEDLLRGELDSDLLRARSGEAEDVEREAEDQASGLDEAWRPFERSLAASPTGASKRFILERQQI